MRKKEENEEVKKTWKEEEKEQDENKKGGNVEDERGEKGEKEEKVTEEEEKSEDEDKEWEEEVTEEGNNEEDSCSMTLGQITPAGGLLSLYTPISFLFSPPPAVGSTVSSLGCSLIVCRSSTRAETTRLLWLPEEEEGEED